ncbi:hypothetical protein DAEQUDRAFT_768920 [Daedalea quercina L-15889]|uniref:Uncharacterized protein n=1 Tax=Daedalea quercina L-15889 TaxID=1314783 RepID=A0A165M8C5_9APHY|nr:hypothetical protein DAEQUDRAFT_768920 [Daedalea quercina L-15889]
MVTPWGTYANQLIGMGYGYPLWDPEPERGEVLIGDVGFLVKGRFHRLFNPTLPSDHEVNRFCGVPDVFEELKIPDHLYSHKVSAISAETICSKSFTRLDVKGKGTVDQGAVLVLPTKTAESMQLLPNSLLPKYMSRNHPYWHEFATEKAQLDLKEEDIILVGGWVKTARWAVAAFAEGGREVEVSFGAGHAALADASFSITAKHGLSRTWYQHFGPISDVDASNDGMSTSATRQAQDQCVFLHYYKSKRRLGIFHKFLPKAIAAAGEPREENARDGYGSGPPEDDDTCPAIIADSDSLIEEVPQRSEDHDPTAPILDYILQCSDVSVAVTSTMDLFASTDPDYGTPSESIRGWLDVSRPPIQVTVVDGWRVGSLHGLNDGADSHVWFCLFQQ